MLRLHILNLEPVPQTQLHHWPPPVLGGIAFGRLLGESDIVGAFSPDFVRVGLLSP